MPSTATDQYHAAVIKAGRQLLTVVRYLADPRNPDACAAFHKLVAELASVPLEEGDGEGDEGSPSPSDGDTAEGSASSGARPSAKTAKTAK